MAFLWVALGGAIGASLRFGASLAAPQPWTIATINILGSFAMGFLAMRWAGQDTLRLFFTTGVLGGFTTFSAFSLDAVTYITKGETFSALSYIFASVLLAMLACFFGIWLAR